MAATDAAAAPTTSSAVEVRLQVRAAYSPAEFNATVQAHFRRSFAGLACFGPGGGGCLDESQVALSPRGEARRASGGGAGLLVDVTLSGAPSAAAAAAVAVGLTDDRINGALRAEGLAPVTVTSAAVVRAAAGTGVVGTASPAVTTAAAGTTATPISFGPTASSGAAAAAADRSGRAWLLRCVCAAGLLVPLLRRRP